MIRYKCAAHEIADDIRRQDREANRKEPWLEKACKLTAELQRQPRKKIPSHWGEVKRVYTLRQKGKCAYCERLLGRHELSAVEFDVEHFRPKNQVAPWPDARTRAELGLPAGFPRSNGKGPGYRLLAYHYLNYASSCKTCNGRLKGCFFPIAGTHHFAAADPVEAHRREKPYLIYPLADFDDDPEDLIEFRGIVAAPAQPPTDTYRHDRGRVTITFFRLNAERDDLLLMRAKQLDNVLSKLEVYRAATTKHQRITVWQDIVRLADQRNDHAGCVRSFLRQYGDPQAARIPATRAAALEGLELARRYVRTSLGE